MYRRYCLQGVEFDVDAVRAYNREDVDSLRVVIDSLPVWLGQDAAAEAFEERIVNIIAHGGPLTCSQIEEAMALPKKGGMVYPALLRLRSHRSVAQVPGGWDLT